MDLPLVSIIVPARNEEACLAACLESLIAQSPISREIIVVDDGSTDRTRAIAESFSAVRIVSADPLPRGWIGKNNAMVSGARRARGQWLLFTDADTVHHPGSLVKAVSEAESHKADLLSYSPQQEVHGFWERAVMPVIFAELAREYRPSEVSDSSSTMAAANGQYLLITRQTYDAVGGHAEVAASLLEDVALARAVKSSGRKIFFRYGRDAVRTRMYRSFAQLREGWTKNLALLFPSAVSLSVLRFGEFALIVGAAAVAVFFLIRELQLPAAMCALFASALYLFFLNRIRRAHFPWTANLLALLGLPIFSYLLIRSKLSYKSGRVSWKGRSYVPAEKEFPYSGRHMVREELAGTK